MLKSNSATLVGRQHDYKADPNCLYIGDLKVPKKYITINVGATRPDRVDEMTPLSIVFESICTTRLNGEVYKLRSKDAEAILVDFNKPHMVLEVNPNKSDSIKILLDWHDIAVCAFSKKILYDGEVHDSPLPMMLESMCHQDIDLRITADIFRASHYLALSDSPDYNLQIAVLKAIPVVLKLWCERAAQTPQNMSLWLTLVPSKFQLQGSRGVSLVPDESRQSLLEGESVFICCSSPIHTKAARLKKWLALLLPLNLNCITWNQLARSPSECTLRVPFFRLFCVCAGEHSGEVGGKILDSQETLWQAVAHKDVSRLHRFTAEDFRSLADDESATASNNDSRRKRRKLQRVENTQFFLLNPSSSIAGSQISQKAPEDETPPQASTKQEKEVDKSPSVTSQLPPNRDTSPSEATRTSEATSVSQESHTETVLDDSTNVAAQHIRIKPLVSLADAILNTKQQAVQDIKEEQTESISEDAASSIVVEDYHYSRKPLVETSNSMDRRGRVNFKRFRKAGKVPTNLTRAYIQLEQDGSGTCFVESGNLARVLGPNGSRKELDLEMKQVRGLEPRETQLFVDEDASDNDDGVSAGSFFSVTRGGKQVSAPEGAAESDDDDGAFTFRFSRNA